MFGSELLLAAGRDPCIPTSRTGIPYLVSRTPYLASLRLDSRIPSRLKPAHENKIDSIDLGTLPRRGSRLLRQPGDGHLEVEREQIEDRPRLGQEPDRRLRGGR